MDRDTARQIAQARGDALVGVQWGQRASWLMPPKGSTLDRLMECLGTDRWEQWQTGRYRVLDARGNELAPLQRYRWDRVPSPLTVEAKPRAKRLPRRTAELAFASAMYCLAFGRHQDEAATARERKYLQALESAARKLSIDELRLLADIADGVDQEGETLRHEVSDE